MARPLIFLHIFCIGGILATSITHGFTRMRPVRSLQIPPESGICPTDFTDIHRFIVGGFGHADFADDADFFHRVFLFIGFHGINSEISCYVDYSRIYAEATCSVVADTPLEWNMSHRFHRFAQIFPASISFPSIFFLHFSFLILSSFSLHYPFLLFYLFTFLLFYFFTFKKAAAKK